MLKVWPEGKTIIHRHFYSTQQNHWIFKSFNLPNCPGPPCDTMILSRLLSFSGFSGWIKLQEKQESTCFSCSLHKLTLFTMRLLETKSLIQCLAKSIGIFPLTWVSAWFSLKLILCTVRLWKAIDLMPKLCQRKLISDQPLIFQNTKNVSLFQCTTTLLSPSSYGIHYVLINAVVLRFSLESWI